MKKKQKGSTIAFAGDLADSDTIKSLNKEKSRLLPDVFYVRWEVELLSALVAIIVLLLLPDWLNQQVNIYLSRYDVSMHTGWISFTCKLLLACFAFYIIVRVFWIFIVSRKVAVPGKNVQLVGFAGQMAEYIFSVCLIILMLVILVSVIQFLAILLKGIVSGKMNSPVGVNG